MPKVVCVHGVAQQRSAAEVLHRQWAPAMCGGVKLAGGELSEEDVACAFYGHLFRPPGRRLAVSDSLLRNDRLDDFENDMLLLWWREASQVDPRVIAPGARTLVRAPGGAQAAIRALSGSQYFTRISERALLGDLRQVRRYLHEPDVRVAAQEYLAATVDDDTRVVVGHSLGSVVAYEGLCNHPEWPVRTFVSVGSPLGIPLIFNKLQPAPLYNAHLNARQGQWPGNVRSWINVADKGDIVALMKDLRPAFGPDVTSWIVDNGARAHDVVPYLTAVETGQAIWSGLVED